MPKSTIELKALLSLPFACSPAVSDDGARVAFCWDVTGRMELYAVELPAGNRFR